MKRVAIGDLTGSVSTWNPASVPDAKFTYVDLSAIDNEEKVVTAPAVITGREAPSRARQRIRTGDVLVSTVRPNLNAVAIVGADLDGATASTGFTVLRTADQLDPRYLFHWVRTPHFVADMVRKATGASYPAVSDRIVKNSEIPLPNLDEQRRIAAMLDQADGLRLTRRETLAQLNSLEESLFLDMFDGRVVDQVSFSSVATGMRNGLSPAKAGQVIADVLTLSAVTQGRFDPTAVKSSTFIVSPPPLMRVSCDDFLICRGNGNLTLCGVGVHPKQDYPSLTFPDTVIAATLDAAKVDPVYLEAAWKRPAVRRQIEAVARTTNGTFKINQQSIGGVKVPLPPRTEQQEFARRIRAIPRPGLDDLNALFVSLQSRAFSGQL